MSTVDFTQYAQAISAFDKADTLKASASMVRASWLITDDNAANVSAALPPLGTMGAPKKGSDHKAMADAIRALFPDATDDARKHRVTRVFLLCRVAASPVNARKEDESIEDYAKRVDSWARVCDKEDGDKVRALIDGTYGKRGPKGDPVDNGGDGDDDDGDTSTDGTLAGDSGKPSAANLIPVVFAGRRTIRQAYEAGKIDQATWDAYLSDMAYEYALDKSARAPIQASA